MSPYFRTPDTPVSLTARDIAFANNTRVTYNTPDLHNRLLNIATMPPNREADNELPGSAALHQRHLREQKNWIEQEMSKYKQQAEAQRKARLWEREEAVTRQEPALKGRKETAEEENLSNTITKREEEVAEREKAMDVFEKWLSVEEKRAGMTIGRRASTVGGDENDDGTVHDFTRRGVNATFATPEDAATHLVMKSRGGKDEDTTTAGAASDHVHGLKDTAAETIAMAEVAELDQTVFEQDEHPFPGFSWASQGTYSTVNSQLFINYSDPSSTRPSVYHNNQQSLTILDDDISISLEPGAVYLPRRLTSSTAASRPSTPDLHVKFADNKNLPGLPNLYNKKRANLVYPRSAVPSPVPDSPTLLQSHVTFSASTEFLTLSDVESEIFDIPGRSNNNRRRNYATMDLDSLNGAVQQRRSRSNTEKTLRRMMSFADLKRGARRG